jgi:tRNA(fMet)-specific endonuclease VapC
VTRYLLDTNIVSDLVRFPLGRVMQRIQNVGEAQVCISIIVAAELRYGAERRRPSRLTTQVERVLGDLVVLPLEAPVDELYGVLRTRLERAGRTISGNDLLIAAHALTLGCTVVTDNEGEFRRIEELPVENWLRDG